MITVHIGLGLGVPVNEKRIVDVDINRSNVMANPLTSADIICVNINHALDLLLFPLRLTVTMRS